MTVRFWLTQKRLSKQWFTTSQRLLGYSLDHQSKEDRGPSPKFLTHSVKLTQNYHQLSPTQVGWTLNLRRQCNLQRRNNDQRGGPPFHQTQQPSRSALGHLRISGCLDRASVPEETGVVLCLATRDEYPLSQYCRTMIEAQTSLDLMFWAQNLFMLA